MQKKGEGFSLVEICVVGFFSLGGVSAYFVLLKKMLGQGSVFFEGLGVFFVVFMCSAKAIDIWQNKKRDKLVDAQKIRL